MLCVYSKDMCNGLCVQIETKAWRELCEKAILLRIVTQILDFN